MSPARCGHCGGQAISYRAHLVNLSPTRLCDSCGRPVRKRGFWTILLAAAAVGAVIGYYALTGRETPGPDSWLVIAAGVAVLLVTADYLTWRWLRWAAEEPEDLEIEAPPAKPAESRHT